MSLYVWIFFVYGVVDVFPLKFEYRPKAWKYHEFCCWNPCKLAVDYFYFITNHFYQTTPLSGKKWNVRSEATISLKDKCGRGRRGTVEECDGLSRCRPTGQNPPPLHDNIPSDRGGHRTVSLAAITHYSLSFIISKITPLTAFHKDLEEKSLLFLNNMIYKDINHYTITCIVNLLRFISKLIISYHVSSIINKFKTSLFMKNNLRKQNFVGLYTQLKSQNRI